MITFADLRIEVIAPEIVVASMACVILLFDLILPTLYKNRTCFILTILALLLAIGVIFLGYQNSDEIGLVNLVVQDRISSITKLGICFATIAVLIYGQGYSKQRKLMTGEFLVLTMFGITGLMVMVSANHLLTLYIGIELFSLCLYALIALNRDSAVAAESAMKYFILGALASGVLLFGISLLYGLTGVLEITAIRDVIASMPADELPLVLAMVLVIVGLLFKLGAVPFHMWVPDVYAGSPTSVTVLLATAPKIAAFVIVFRLVAIGLGPLVELWQDMLMAVGLLSVAFGNVVAIAQKNIKRMLAYSTISHMGFLLLGIMCGVTAGYSAAMLYAAIYTFTSLAAFGCILLFSKSSFEADQLDDYKGLSRTHPWLAFLLLIVMFSLAGIPPTIGFYAKLSIFQAVIGSGLIWVAVVAALFTVVGAFYYLRIVKLIYFDESPEADEALPIDRSASAFMLLTINALFLIALIPWVGDIAKLFDEAIRLTLL